MRAMLNRQSFILKANRTVSGRVKQVIRTMDGSPDLNVVEYDVPEPSYAGSSCAPALHLSGDPDQVHRGLFASALENDHFAWILDQICEGLGSRLRGGMQFDMGPESVFGSELRGNMIEWQRQGVVQAVMRATETRVKKHAEKFVAAMRDESLREEMSRLVSKIPAAKSNGQKKGMAKALRRYGLVLTLKLEESDLLARQTLRQLIWRPMGGG